SRTPFSGGRIMFRTQQLGLALGMTVLLGLAVPARAQTTEPFTGEGLGIITDVQGETYFFALEGLGEPLGQFGGEGAFLLHNDGSIFGKVTFVNADGDKVFAVFEAQLLDDGSYMGTLTIVGGDGKFAHASGTAALGGAVFDDGS